MLIQGDARYLPLSDQSVQCVVTSPPYFGLRDYGSASQIGLEPTPAAYVASLVTVFREVWRVLRDDGTVWLNLGDSYNSAAQFNAQFRDGLGVEAKRYSEGVRGDWAGHRPMIAGLKPKDLLGIPWLVAFALRDDGWYLRSDIIWSKPNPMPESVTDRPTKAHEYLFLLSKSERYYYDAAAIAERGSDALRVQVEQGYDGEGLKDYAAAGVQNPSSVKARIIAGARKRLPLAQHKQAALGQNGTGYLGTNDPFLTRNKRSVWEIPTQPYAGAHFATFPEALVEPCVLAGSRLGDVVLDPFCGSGTVPFVAERFGRRWVGIDLAYQGLASERTQQRGIQFT